MAENFASVEFARIARKTLEKKSMKKSVIRLFLVVLIVSATAFGQRASVGAAEATGTFTTGRDGNQLKIFPLGKGRLKVEFWLIHYRKMANGEDMVYTGEPRGVASIVGDVAVLDLSEDDRVCKITLKFRKPGVIDVTEGDNCGGIVGGMNVTTVGNYRRISARRPKFGF